MDGSKINTCGTPSRVSRQVRWLFDEIDPREESDGKNSEKEMEHQESVLSSTDASMDMPSYSVMESFVVGNKSDLALSSLTLSSTAAFDSINEQGGIMMQDSECGLETTCSVSVAHSEPASTVTSLEKQQYLQNIVDNVSSLFPDLAFVLEFDGLDRSNPFLTISQRNLFSHPPYGMAS